MRQRLELKEVSLEPVEKDTEGKRMNAKMVCELEVLPSGFSNFLILYFLCIGDLFWRGNAHNLVHRHV